MAWICVMYELAGHADWEQTEDGGRRRFQLWKDSGGSIIRFENLPIGAMWFDACCECGRGDGCPHATEGRELCVKMPGGSCGSIWNIDQGRSILARRPPGKGHGNIPSWTRTGNPPLITVSPSINWIGHYHGWLRDGVLTDDIEGRRLDNEGKLIK